VPREGNCNPGDLDHCSSCDEGYQILVLNDSTFCQVKPTTTLAPTTEAPVTLPEIFRGIEDDEFQDSILDDDEDYSPLNSYPSGSLDPLDEDDFYQAINQKISSLEQTDLDNGFLRSDQRWELAKSYKTKQLLEMLTYGIDEPMGIQASRFFNYGCYCGELERNPGMQGHGRAVDPLDLTCQLASKCRHCAEMDLGDRCHSYRSYSFETAVVNGQKTISCTDSGSGEKSLCRRTLCECDKHFVDSMVAQKFEFNQANNVMWGFNKDQKCPTAACKNSESGCLKPDSCCGNFPTRLPYSSESGSKSCCSGSIYSTSVNKCCEGLVTDLGDERC